MASSLQKDYTTIECCIAGPGISPDLLTTSDSIYPGCHCKETCSSDCDPPCSCSIAYNTDSGLLLDTYLSKYSPPLFECNAKCGCNLSCFNRATQRYTCSPNVDLFYTRRKGLGLHATRFTPKGSYLGEYIGEVLSTSQTMERLGELEATDSCYIVQYKEHLSTKNSLITNIDATNNGNLLRFVNHSCSPNLTMIAVRSNSLLPRLCLFATRDILPSEEMCFSYFGRNETGATLKTGDKQCFCDSKECVGYLPLMK